MSWDPCHGKAVAKTLLEKSTAVVQPRTLFAAAGYDAEWVHAHFRDDWEVSSWIPPAGNRLDGGANGQYRSKMIPPRLKKNRHGRRWIGELLMSGLKRATRSMLQAHNQARLFTKDFIRVFAYALRR